MGIPRRLFFIIIALCALVGLSSGCTRKARAARHLARAEKYFEAGQYPRAEVEYLNVIQRDQLNARAFARLGTIYYEQGRFMRANAFLTRASELATNDLDLRVKLATINLAGRKSKEGRDQAAFVLERMPTNAEAPILLAESVTSKKELEDVRLRLEKVAATIGKTAPLQTAFGVLVLKQGDVKAAEACFKNAVELDPKFSAAHFALGNMYWASNDLKGADAALKTAADLSLPRSVRRLSYAEFKIRTGELAEGKRLLAEISKQTPDYVPAWLQQAEIALAEKDYTNCAALVNQALARDPDNFEASLIRARMLLAQRDGPKALETLERVPAIYKQKIPQLHYYSALAQLLNNDATKAMQSLNQAVVLDPNYTEAILALAELNIRKGNAGAAIAPLLKLTQQRPQIPAGHLLLASAYAAQKNLDQAAEVYRHAMALFPNSPQLPYLLGVVLSQQKKSDEARQALAKSIERAPDFLPALEQLVDLDLAQKDYAAALERATTQLAKKESAESHLLVAKVHMARALDYLQKEKQNAGNANTNISLARIPEAKPDVDAAEASLLKAIELNPDLRGSYYILSQLLVASHRHEQALNRLNALVAKTNDVTALMQIGMINEELKNPTAARDAYEKLLAINPGFPPALNNLAYLYSERLNQPDKAYEMADRARQLLPSDPFLADTLGWIVYRKGDYSRALGLIQEGANGMPDDPEIQFHLGMTYYMLGEEKLAQAALERSLQGVKDFAGKEEGRWRLAFLSTETKPDDAAGLAELEKRLQGEPNDPVVANRLAAIYEHNGQTGKAAQTYERLLKQNPKNVQVLSRLALLYSEVLKDKPKALALAKEAHSLAADDPTICRTLGRLVYASGDYKWALSLLQEAARKLPGQAELLYELAWAYYSTGKAEEAETSMQEALQTGAAFAKAEDAKRFLALVAAAKTPVQALSNESLIQETLKSDSNYVPALMASALLKEQQGNNPEAKQLYEKVLAANSLFTPAARNLAILCAQHFEEDAKAYDYALKAREAYPEDAELGKALGILAYNRKDYSRAAQVLSQCAEKRNDDAEVYYYLGMSHYRLGHRSESKAALQKALALNAPVKFAAEAKRVLAELS
jgi:tetratricopeptide (TPR) repeat protein